MKLLITAIDILLTVIGGVIFMPLIAIFYLILVIFAQNRHKAKVKEFNLVRLVPANLNDLKNKGVMWMLYDSDENGYFNHVYTVHYPAEKAQKISLNPTHTVIEINKICVFLKNLDFFYLYTFINGIYFLWNIIGLKKLVKTKISVIRGHDPDHMGLAAMLLNRLTGVPYCISVHADHDKRYEITGGRSVYALFNSKLLTSLLRRVIFSNAPMVMAIRQSLIPYLENYGVKPKNIRVIPHGIHLDEFGLEIDLYFEKQWKVSGRKIAVFAGRLYPENYITDIITIAENVSRHIPDVLFIMLGDGVERNLAEKMVKEKKLGHNVVFLGFRPLKEVIKFRKMADVNLCLMAGFSLIEAAAAGRPIVSYNVEWHHEIVKNEETGFLIREHDVDAASEAVIELMQDSVLAKNLGANARRLAFRDYSIEKASRIKISCYNELTGRAFSEAEDV